MDPARHVRALIEASGWPDDPELVGTPERFTELLASFAPRDPEPPSICATTSDAPVVVSGIAFHSLCAHHLLPFFGTVSVGYRPRARLLGLGSVPRAVAAYARRPQIQERLGAQIADALVAWADPVSVVVAITARHLCVEMRGARAEAEVLTVVSRGEPDPWLLARVS
ncbi:MAG: GTP cyclohydrolase I [Myxococcota bacterium]